MKLSLIVFLCFLLFFPLIQAWLYFVQMADWNPAIQKFMYVLTKTIMLAVPVVYTIGVAKEPLRLYPFSTRGMIEGNCFGLGILTAVCFLYFFWLKPLGVIAPNTPVADAIAERVKAFGLLSSVRFVLFGIFVSLIHSALEEYYWRWFTFRQLSRVISQWSAMIVSGLGFMLHHIVILGVYFRFDHWETWLFSLAVAVGGIYWAWLYSRNNSIYASWISHAWIDIAIFIVGYDVLFTG